MRPLSVQRLSLERVDDVLRVASILIGEGIEMIDLSNDAARHRLAQGDALLRVVLEQLEARQDDKLTQDGGEG
jgi:hypothetical protein